MLIYVTKEDIINGSHKDCSFCPIAVALKSAYKRSFLVSKFQAMDEKSEDWYSLPWNVVEFIEDFDNSKKVSSFSFSFPAPQTNNKIRTLVNLDEE